MRRSIGAGAIPMLADSLLRTSGECASFTKPGAARRNSHHWRENWTGGTTRSFFASTSTPKNASFTCVCHCVVRRWHPYVEVNGCVTIFNCPEFHFFRLFVVLIGGRPSCLGTGGINGDVGLRAGWLSVFVRVDASTGRRKRSGRQKEANWAIPMSWREQRQKSQSWNCGYEPSSRRTNTPSGFVIRLAIVPLRSGRQGCCPLPSSPP